MELPQIAEKVLVVIVAVLLGFIQYFLHMILTNYVLIRLSPTYHTYEFFLILARTLQFRYCFSLQMRELSLREDVPVSLRF